MYMLIHGDRLLRELQEEFQSSYPYLKMVFFWKKNKKDTPASLSEDQEVLIRLCEISTKKGQGFIPLEDHTSLHQMTKFFETDFGTDVRVLHFTNAGWVYASDLHQVTLGELNEQGRLAFHSIHNVSANPNHLL